MYICIYVYISRETEREREREREREQDISLIGEVSWGWRWVNKNNLRGTAQRSQEHPTKATAPSPKQHQACFASTTTPKGCAPSSGKAAAAPGLVGVHGALSKSGEAEPKRRPRLPRNYVQEAQERGNCPRQQHSTPAPKHSTRSDSGAAEVPQVPGPGSWKWNIAEKIWIREATSQPSQHNICQAVAAAGEANKELASPSYVEPSAAADPTKISAKAAAVQPKAADEPAKTSPAAAKKLNAVAEPAQIFPKAADAQPKAIFPKSSQDAPDAELATRIYFQAAPEAALATPAALRLAAPQPSAGPIALAAPAAHWQAALAVPAAHTACLAARGNSSQTGSSYGIGKSGRRRKTSKKKEARRLQVLQDIKGAESYSSDLEDFAVPVALSRDLAPARQ